MTNLKAGDPAPHFKGTDQNGNDVNMDDFDGQKIVLYFYPKDDTPGCTTQACNLRDHYQTLLSQNYAVVGVSADSVRSHKKFQNKYHLPFPLIADADKKIILDYGVWGEKKFMGRKYQGIHRVTFVIGVDRKIERVIEQVKTKEHTGQILE